MTSSSGCWAPASRVIARANPGARPATGVLALVWLIGAYAIIFGLTLFALAWRVHELGPGERGHKGGAGLHQPAAS